MPLPSPRSGETEKKFVSRCMGDPQARKDFPNSKERAGMCFSRFRKGEGAQAPKQLRPKAEVGFTFRTDKDDLSREALAQAGGLVIPESLLPSKRKKKRNALEFLFATDHVGFSQKVETEQDEAMDILRECAKTVIAIRTKDERKESGERVDALQIRKADDELQIVWGEVYIPDLPDSQGDFMTADEVRKAAYRFVGSGRLDQIDRMHDNEPCGAMVVESFIAREGDPDFIPGAWVVGVHVPDPEIWQAIKSGEFNGFSMQGRALRTQKAVELEIPEEVQGITETTGDHRHAFVVSFGEEGEFLGGEALPEAGAGGDLHGHDIKRGTATGPGGADGHAHRYSFSEAILEVALGTASTPQAA
jgi:hypothetical protein